MGAAETKSQGTFLPGGEFFCIKHISSESEHSLIFHNFQGCFRSISGISFVVACRLWRPIDLTMSKQASVKDTSSWL